MKSLGRLVRYLTRYPRQAALPYLFLIVASLDSRPCRAWYVTSSMP